MKIKAPYFGRLKNFPVNEMQRMDVQEDVHVAGSDLPSE